MKITYKGDYALKALLELSLRYIDEGPYSVITIQDIARQGDMPKKFLEQILLTLKKGGFVKSRRGIEGGFYLAMAPKNVTVGDVIRFIEGPIGPIECVERDSYKGCRDTKSCILRSVWTDVRNAISTVIDSLTFEELVVRYKEKGLNMRGVYEYSI